MIDANLNICSCNCPYASSCENCKHEYAVLLAISHHDYELAREFLIKLGKGLNTLFNSLWVKDNEERLFLISSYNNVILKR